MLTSIPSNWVNENAAVAILLELGNLSGIFVSENDIYCTPCYNKLLFLFMSHDMRRKNMKLGFDDTEKIVAR